MPLLAKLISFVLLSTIACHELYATALDPTALDPTEIQEISRAQYRDQLHGFWLAQSIANWTGLITEMDKVGTKETLPFYTDEDWGKADLKAMWGEYVPHSSTIDFFFVEKGEPWGADDDTDIEYMYQYLLEVNQSSMLTAEQMTRNLQA